MKPITFIVLLIICTVMFFNCGKLTPAELETKYGPMTEVKAPKDKATFVYMQDTTGGLHLLVRGTDGRYNYLSKE